MSPSEHSTNFEQSPPASPGKKRTEKQSEVTVKKKKETVRKTVSPTKVEGGAMKKVAASSKKRKREESDDEEDDEDGFEVVGTIVPAPTTGRGARSLVTPNHASRSNELATVPPGRISQNTLSFLKKLQDPKCNDREW
jgi:hypothetical protein